MPVSKPTVRALDARHARQLARSARRLDELAAFIESGLLVDQRTLVNNLKREASVLRELVEQLGEEEEMPTLRPGQVQAPGLRMEQRPPRRRRVSET